MIINVLFKQEEAKKKKNNPSYQEVEIAADDLNHRKIELRQQPNT